MIDRHTIDQMSHEPMLAPSQNAIGTPSYAIILIITPETFPLDKFSL